MPHQFYAEVLTPSVLAAQEHTYGRSLRAPPSTHRDLLGSDEAEFIERRDSFYLATVTSRGWPYLQHRGGPTGFLKVLEPSRLCFADFRGNRQLVSTGNLQDCDRAALLLMDYPQRQRLKILGHVRVLDPKGHRALADHVASAALRPKVERLFLIDVVGFDWNCPAHITPRFTLEETERAEEPLRRRIAELEAALRQAGGSSR